MYLTGEFSKIARVSKRLLQYYDGIGLLTPAHIDPQTGYRYYSAKQLPRLNRILALKELGLTLQQITRMLDEDVSNDEIHGMLMMQKAELGKQLLDDMDRFRRIETRLQAQYANQPDVVLKSIPELDMLSINHFCLSSDEVLRFIGGLIQQLPAKVGSQSLGHLVTLVNAEDFRAENVEVEFGFLLEASVPSTVTLAADLILKTRTLPAAPTMATSIYLGHLSGSHVAYGALGTWIENNQYQIVGQQREIFIELPRPGQELVLEVQFPVARQTLTPFALQNQQ